jgi:hypothetical protein
MLSGRQWDVWSPLHGRFVDVLQFMTPESGRRACAGDGLPRLLVPLTLAKATENEPTIIVPAGDADRLDAMLAESWIRSGRRCSTRWRCDARVTTMVGWQLVAGCGYFATRVDFRRAASASSSARRARLEQEGAEPIERVADAVPYDAAGNPLARARAGSGQPQRSGGLRLRRHRRAVRGSRGRAASSTSSVRSRCARSGAQHIPWRDKRWIAVETFLLPSRSTSSSASSVIRIHYVGDDEEGPGYLERMLFGTGYFGSTQNDASSLAGAPRAKRGCRRAMSASSRCGRSRSQA